MSKKPYRYHYTVSCEFPTFPDTIDNQLMPLCYSTKIIPPPCTQGVALALPFTTHWRYLIAKVQIIIENKAIIQEKTQNLIEKGISESKSKYQ